MSKFKYIEVSHTIKAGMKTYPGLPVPEQVVVIDHDTCAEKYDGKSEFLIASLHLCGNTGTYVDAPIHRYRDGFDLAAYPLDSLAHVPVVLVDATDKGRSIGRDAFKGHNLEGKAVLVRTDFSKRWGTDAYFEDNTFLPAETCDFLLDSGVKFVGIDSLNIDDMGDLYRPAHTRLLKAGIPICEHMDNLAAVPKEGGYIHAVPIAWEGGATFPVRAYVMVD